jgi:hypothetical protein
MSVEFHMAFAKCFLFFKEKLKDGKVLNKNDAILNPPPFKNIHRPYKYCHIISLAIQVPLSLKRFQCIIDHKQYLT